MNKIYNDIMLILNVVVVRNKFFCGTRKEFARSFRALYIF